MNAIYLTLKKNGVTATLFMETLEWGILQNLGVS